MTIHIDYDREENKIESILASQTKMIRTLDKSTSNKNSTLSSNNFDYFFPTLFCLKMVHFALLDSSFMYYYYYTSQTTISKCKKVFPERINSLAWV